MKGLSLQPLHEFEKRIAKEKEEGRLKISNDHLKGQKKKSSGEASVSQPYGVRTSKALRLCISATDHL